MPPTIRYSAGLISSTVSDDRTALSFSAECTAQRAENDSRWAVDRAKAKSDKSVAQGI